MPLLYNNAEVSVSCLPGTSVHDLGCDPGDVSLEHYYRLGLTVVCLYADIGVYIVICVGLFMLIVYL